MNQKQQILTRMKPHLSELSQQELDRTLDEVLHPAHLDISNENAINTYVRYCRFRNLSEQTISSYKAELERIGNKLPNGLINATSDELKEYFTDKKEKGISATTINWDITIAQKFYSFLVDDEEWLTANPMRKIHPIKEPKKMMGTFSEDGMEKLKEYCKCSRDKALVEFMVSSGCRVSEVTRLKIKDIDFNSNCAKVIAGKGSKDRVVAFSKKAATLIKKYLKYRNGYDSSDFLFVQLQHGYPAEENKYNEKQLTKNAIQRFFWNAADMSEIENCHAHSCRHYCITTLLRKGMPLKLVSMQAGHSSVSTTADVYANLTVDDMQEAYQYAMR